MSKISKVIAREVLDSRGFPTVEADVILDNGVVGRAIVPSGASTGTHEALELRDGDKSRFFGKGVLRAVDNVKKTIGPSLLGMSPDDLKTIDEKILSLDGTLNKSKLGANAILSVSLACAKASALNQKITLAEWIRDQSKALGYSCDLRLPIPLMNVINGGAHADNGLDIQEFMLVPHGFTRFSEALRAGAEVFHTLKKILSSRNLVTAVGDEGGFAPRLSSNKEALDLLMKAIAESGYEPGKHISLALDVASTEFFENGIYKFKDQSLGALSGSKLVDVYLEWAKTYPLVSIEDGFAEDDWSSWSEARMRSPQKPLQWVGDDLFVTQAARLQTGIEKKAANAILIKLNQVGSLLETLQTMALASKSGFKSVVSHRSGETEDTTLSHLAVGTGAGQVKTGSLSRSDRIAKYNELLRLEEVLKPPFGFQI